MFVLTISCFTMSDFPWFMDLTFQVPIQYCSLHHQILLASPDTSTTECRVRFGPTASFILGLLVFFLHASPVAYWTPSDLGDSSLGVISFWPFIQFMRFSRQIYCWFAIPSFSRSCFVRVLCYNLAVLGSSFLNGSSLHWVTRAPLPRQGSDPWRGYIVCK